MKKTLLTGIAKVLDRGTADPDAVRFHVPDPLRRWRQVTCGQVLDHARKVALYLDSEGVRKGCKVSVYANTSVEWGYVVPAIEACRAVFVPVYFSNTAEQVAYVVDHCDAEVIFTEKALLPRMLEHWHVYTDLRQIIVWDLDNLDAVETIVDEFNHTHTASVSLDSVVEKAVGFDHVLGVGEAHHRAHPGRLEEMVDAIDEDDIAAIIYTSGTTGVPKGAMLSNKNLLATAQSWVDVLEHAFPAPGDRRDILWLPISHMSGWGILGQGTMFDYETWLSDPYQLLSILPEVKPTMLLSVPAYWEKMYGLALNMSPNPEEQYAELRRLTGGRLTFLLSGGAGLKREVKDFFKAAGIHMIEGYGMTECSPNLTMNRLDDYDFDSVGKPMPGVTINIADDGEIIVKGDNVFQGYYKMPEVTAACFDDDGWFHTGDLGAWRPGGFVKIIGRKKEIIVTSGGKKIGPVGVESQFVGNPYVEHVVLYGNEKKYLVALITPNQLGVEQFAQERGLSEPSFPKLVTRPEVHELIKEQVNSVNARLASYETIKKFHLHPGHLSVAAGHLTPSLKVRRQRVWEDFEGVLESLY